MRLRSVCTLILACGLALESSAAPQQAAMGYLGSYIWRSEDPRMGGMSAIEVAPNGRDFTALSDRGGWTRGSFKRDAQGRITGLSAEKVRRLKGLENAPLKANRSDSEGLAIAADGTAFVSLEGAARVLRYDDLGGSATNLPTPAAFRALPRNSALEALAIDRNGALYTLPEDPPGTPKAIPVYRFKAGKWTQPFAIPREGTFLPVAADFGPDGKLYLLERQFRGILGFASRVRRFALRGNDIGPGETLLQTRPGEHDNLEGMAVWRDQGGIRLTLIADDNFNFFQTTEIVEFRIPD